VVVISHENDKLLFSFQLDVAKSSAGHFSLSHTPPICALWLPYVDGFAEIKPVACRVVWCLHVSGDHVERRGGTFQLLFQD
jgi:hypothetical protein